MAHESDFAKFKKSGMGKMKEFELKQKNRDFLKHQQDEAKQKQDNHFLANARHKITSEKGLKIYDTLAVLRREEITKKTKKNLQFNNGIAYIIDTEEDFRKKDKVIPAKKNISRRFDRTIKITLKADFVSNLYKALNGGTEDRWKHIKAQDMDINDRDPESSDDDMFAIKKDLTSTRLNSFVYDSKSSANAQFANQTLTQAKSDFTAEEHLIRGLKSDISNIKATLVEEAGEHYQECFPAHLEEDFQESVKDNKGGLRKRPPKGGNPANKQQKKQSNS